jgi:hypothetical protein
MEELLSTIQKSGLLDSILTTVYVTLLGNSSNVYLATETLREFNRSGNVHVLTRGADLYVAELPTIHAIHSHAQASNPR